MPAWRWLGVVKEPAGPEPEPALHDASLVVGAVAVQAAEWHVHPRAEQRQGPALLLGPRIAAADVDRALPVGLPGRQVEFSQRVLVGRLGGERHDPQPPGRRVGHRGPGDPGRVDVAAWQAGRDRGRQVPGS